MPPLLRKDSIRLFEASVNSLNLALIGLSLPLRTDIREKGSLYASEVGLIGVTAEQSINACMTQIYGIKGLLTQDKKFKSASQIFDEFLGLLKNQSTATTFLFQGVPETSIHLQELMAKTSKFRILAKSRAGGLHAGFGPSRDVVLALAQDVSDFLILLAKSTRIKPYLSFIPRPHDIVKDRTTLVEDIAKKINNSNNVQVKSALISSVFLILPELNEVKPEWLDAFERINVSPNTNDVVFLLNALNMAIPSTLIRVSGKGEALPVKVDQKNEHAIPISPQFIRREFHQINDQWYADVGNANGRIKSNNMLDLPPQDFILDIFGMGLENLNIVMTENGVPAQQSWPFIASSLSVPGTVFPYWFLVRKTQNLKELVAFIDQAEKISKGHLKRNIPEFYEGVRSIIENRPLKSTESSLIEDILYVYSKIDEKRSRIQDFIDLNKSLDGEETLKIIQLLADEKIDFSETINQILALTELKKPRRIYWIRTLAECCYEEEDIPGLLLALKYDGLEQAKTAIRKSLRCIDFMLYGPDFT
ncbi:MAG: hypothetical protein WD469_14825 [Paenibacillaceae bacterium]